MIGFDHERLKVYQIAIQYIALADNIAFSLPRGRSYLADQLGRAALSIVLNIAEGAGEFSKKGKARFYRRAWVHYVILTDRPRRSIQKSGGRNGRPEHPLVRLRSVRLLSRANKFHPSCPFVLFVVKSVRLLSRANKEISIYWKFFRIFVRNV